ncbi:MAG: hypothetical protein AAB551_04240 [Patescibacteria group bacterium]
MPRTSTKISKPDAKLLEKKSLRLQLQHLLRDRVAHEMPIIGFFIEKEEEFVLIRDLIHGISGLGAGVVIFAPDNKKGEALPFDLYDEAMVIFYDHTSHKNLFSGCDMVVCFSDQAVKKSLASHIVPVAFSECRGVTNYHPNRETGNAFTFEKKDQWHVFAALIRAMETYRFPFDWKCIAYRR